MEQYPKLESITCVNDYFELLRIIKEKDEIKDRIFFRGQASDDWGLLPHIARDGYEKAEYQMIREVMLERPKEFIDLNSFNILAKLQHYGLPTRLLDVTENPLVALYFACIGEPEANGAIYYIDEDYSLIEDCNNIMINLIASIGIASGRFTGGFELNSLIQNLCFTKPELANSLKSLTDNIDDPNMNWIFNYMKRKFRLVLPEKTNERIIRQSGAFILFCNEGRDGNDERYKKDENWFYNKILDIRDSVLENMEFRILVKRNNKESIIKELSILGINEAYLFPELNNICGHIKRKWNGFNANLLI